MPIISDKHVVNISFKHVSSHPEGSETVTDVSAYLEDGIMQVRLKSGNKQITLSVNALMEICEYISQANTGNVAAKNADLQPISQLTSKPIQRSTLEGAIFKAPVNSENSLHAEELNESPLSNIARNYASPTMIAASAAVSPLNSVVSSEPSVVISKLSISPNGENEKNRSKVKRKNSLNLGRDGSLDDEGRFAIDLDDDKE